MRYRAWITQSFKVCNVIKFALVCLRVVSRLLDLRDNVLFSLSQESAYMFRYQRADPEGHMTRRTICLRQAEVFIPLIIQGTGLTLTTEAPCLLTLLLHHHRHPLPQEEHLIPAMASEIPMEWSITMRNTEPVLTAPRAMTTGVPALSPRRRHHHPQHWLGSVLEWGRLIPTSGAHSLHLQVIWSGTEAP